MPPRVNFTRDEIIKASIQVIRDYGSSSLTARNIAKAMGGSTQPLYRIFGTIEEMEGELFKAVRRMAYSVMHSRMDPHSNFLSIGLGYLQFAREEPELFKYAFMESARFLHPDYSKEPFQGVLDKMRKDRELMKLDDDILKGLFRDMWIYTHGIASLILMDPDQWSEEICRGMLFFMGGRLIAVELMKINNNTDYHAILKETDNEDCSAKRQP